MENAECDSKLDKISVDASSGAVNNLILDYYKKFGRKRDLEQFFSLSTAQSEIRDPTSTFWRKMKSYSDSSDSNDNKKSESSTELCRISIKCSVSEPPSLQNKDLRDHQKSDSESPPIITEDIAPEKSHDSDAESAKSDDVHSQRSNDATLDTSMNKPHSPTSSITSQRKLEWDSLADVSYANESDRKTSASSLSTLERLALKQQYSHNDTRENGDIGPPASQSTPLEETDLKSKGKKGIVKKTTKIYQKDVDLVELNVPHSSYTNVPQAISVNLSKHISFNVEKDGEINIDNIKRNISVSPDKVVETERQIQEKIDKEIQTSLLRNKDKSTSLTDAPKIIHKYPVLINLNTLRKRNRKTKLKMARRKLRNKNKEKVDKSDLTQEKTTEQVSEAESFEYMPGHIYNQNHMKMNQSRGTNVGNKSSLESSAGRTTDSSKGSGNFFSKDLEKSLDLLKTVLQQKGNDSTLKKQLIKEVVQRLIKSKYKDDESSTDFLSGLSFNSKTLGLSEGSKTTTSTSDGDINGDKTKLNRPKKSILRKERFNANAMAATSQSAPNLPTISNTEKPITSDPVIFSNTGSDTSYKENMSSDKEAIRTSSEELYKKYLEALRREEAYKKQLKVKQSFLTQKLGGSDSAISQLVEANTKTQSKLKSLLNDLTRNNYNDGSGDASKLESHLNSYLNMDLYPFVNKPRSHSVFTLSSGNSCNKNKLSKKPKDASNCCKAENNKREHHYCCCPYHTDHAKAGVTDSSVQVNIECDNQINTIFKEDVSKKVICMRCKNESPKITKVACTTGTPDLKYVCMCSNVDKASHKVPEKFLIYKCSQLVDKSIQLGDSLTRGSNIDSDNIRSQDFNCKQAGNSTKRQQISSGNDSNLKKQTDKQDCVTCGIPVTQNSKSSQTDVNLDLMLQRKPSVKSVSSQSNECVNCAQDIVNNNPKETQSTNERAQSTNDSISGSEKNSPKIFVHETVRSIQTEISINPKLSDPSLSDIKIIDSTECVKVIGEQHKEITKTSTGSTITTDHSDEKFYQLSNEHCVKLDSKTPVENINQERKEENNVNNDCVNQHNKEVQSESFDNIPSANLVDHFTIPIQGTNMTLKVNLGTNESETIKPENYIKRSQGVVTDRMEVVEQFTSLRDDCTKGVQCTGQLTFEKTIQLNNNEEPKYKNNYKPKVFSPKMNCCLVSTCSGNLPKCNTYPKNDIKIRKPLVRSNTDTSNLEPIDFLKIDLQKNNKTENQQEFQSQREKESDRSNKQIDSNLYSIEKCCTSSSAKSSKADDIVSKTEDELRTQSKTLTSESESQSDYDTNKDPILQLIKDITKRYSKKDVENRRKKKCFKEIMSVLNYLLDTEDSTDEQNKERNTYCDAVSNSKQDKSTEKAQKEPIESMPSSKTCVDKGIQLSPKKSKSNTNRCQKTESSEIGVSTEFPTTSSESATCKVLNKIKKECEKYHQKRCKSHNGLKTCETSSTTSVNCDNCKRVHHCHCTRHKCRSHKPKTTEKPKKCVAYNLILQTSDSVASEDNAVVTTRQLKNIIVKVPSKRKETENIPFREMAAKFERNVPHSNPCKPSRGSRSRSLPDESDISSTEEFLRKAQACTVREYLERNRPDFVEKCSKRQDCLKFINETRANERNAKRKLLSLQLDRQQALSAMTDEELRYFAKQLSDDLRRKKVAPKFINEREMKKHSEKIYKSLPEVTRKKEEMKKENMKKTNLLMANIFKKNLQKKTLRGSVNLSNYSPVIKI